MQVIQPDLSQSAQQRARDSPASNLARQLQLRLRYARLKVDHGWQKQNINEVENLYFHQRHVRNTSTTPSTGRFLPSAGSRPNGNASSGTIHDQEPSSSSTVLNSGPQSSQSLVLQSSDALRPELQLGDTNMQVDKAHSDGTRRDSSSSVPSPLDSRASGTTAPSDIASESVLAFVSPRNTSFASEIESGNNLMGSDLTISSPTVVPLPTAGVLRETLEGASNGLNRSANSGSERKPSPSRPASEATNSQNSFISMPENGMPASASSNAVPNGADSTPSADVASGPGHLPTLTYDSFWSSHSSNSATQGNTPFLSLPQVPLDSSGSVSLAGPAQLEVASEDVDVAMADVL